MRLYANLWLSHHLLGCARLVLRYIFYFLFPTFYWIRITRVSTRRKIITTKFNNNRPHNSKPGEMDGDKNWLFPRVDSPEWPFQFIPFYLHTMVLEIGVDDRVQETTDPKFKRAENNCLRKISFTFLFRFYWATLEIVNKWKLKKPWMIRCKSRLIFHMLPSQ